MYQMLSNQLLLQYWRLTYLSLSFYLVLCSFSGPLWIPSNLYLWSLWWTWLSPQTSTTCAHWFQGHFLWSSLILAISLPDSSDSRLSTHPTHHILRLLGSRILKLYSIFKYPSTYYWLHQGHFCFCLYSISVQLNARGRIILLRNWVEWCNILSMLGCLSKNLFLYLSLAWLTWWDQSITHGERYYLL